MAYPNRPSGGRRSYATRQAGTGDVGGVGVARFGVGYSRVVAQFDGGAVGISHVERRSVTLCAEAGARSFDHVERAVVRQLVEVGWCDDEAEVIEAAGGGVAVDEVDDGVRVDPDGWE